MNYRGQRATIMGLGHFGGGVAAARWLAAQGAVVTVSDAADENALADSLPLLADVPIAAVHLRGHCAEDFDRADLIVVNPAVHPDNPWLHVARQSGARLCTELELFIESCPAKIIAVTGSNGKSTTAAMIASILNASLPSPFGRGAGGEGRPIGDRSALTLALSQREREHSGQRRVFLGGNIGGSLLNELPQITVSDWGVLEISSFQLWHSGAPMQAPHLAVLTGCSPNHLDWHGSFADYVAAKQRILAAQTPEDFAVLNMFDAEVASWLPLVRGRPIPPLPLDTLPTLQVPGEHNRINAACAAAAARAAGCNADEIRRGLAAFRGLPQRLEQIALIDGRRFYNDSTATTPESTIAALRSLDGARRMEEVGAKAYPASEESHRQLPPSPSVPSTACTWLLAGGKSKGFDFQPLAAEIVRHACGAAFFGSTRNELRNHVVALDPQFPCTAVETMQEALDWCRHRSRPGEAIVLSPACASTDQFRNFHERGKMFAELVNKQSRRHP
jgi:UDP-N-acetylmuramoylalanine--D-glutamate ligase